MGSTLRLLAAALVAPALAACGGSSAAPTGPSLLHLDPHAPAGVSARDHLATAEVIVRAWDDLGTAAGRAPWVWNGPSPAPTPDGGLVLAAGPTDQGPAHLALALEPGSAPAFDTLRLTARFAGGCTAGLRLRHADGTLEERPLAVPYDADRTRWDVDLTGVDTSRLVALELAPAVAGDRRELALTGLSLVRKGLPAPAAAPVAGDHGLVELDGVLRRVWPAGRGVALESRIEAPTGSRLRVQAWPGPAAARGARASVLARRVGVPAWTLLAEAPLGSPFDVELDGLAGEGPMELRLQAPGSAAEQDPGQVVVLWSEPRVARPREPHTPPHLVLVTFDTTRADVAGQGSSASNIANLAQGPGGLDFPHAWSSSNTTTPAHASMLTGLQPHRHGAVAVGRQLRRPAGSTLAERLRAAGYRTAAAVSVEHLDAAHGFAAGFDRYLDPSPAAARDGRVALAFAREVLAEAEQTGEPLFLWVHWFDPHTPYLLPADAGAPEMRPVEAEAPAWTRPMPAGARALPHLGWLPEGEDRPELVARYRAAVDFTDHLLGELVAGLEDAGMWQDTALAVTADHGEGLGEGHVFASHASLYPPVTRIPLVLRLPWDEPLDADQRRAPVSSMDLYPTLLELAGLEPEPGLDGRSLLDPAPERRLWLEGDRLSQVGLVDGPHLWIGTMRRVSLGFLEQPIWSDPGDAELYAWADARHGQLGPELLTSAPPTEAQDLRAAWQAYVADLDSQGIETLLSAEERAALEALGYLGED